MSGFENQIGMDPMAAMMGMGQEPSPVEGPTAIEDNVHQPSNVNKRESDKIMARATERFTYAVEYESNTRKKNLDDYMFVESDPDTNYQWPNTVDQYTEDDDLELVLNETRQYCLKIINEIKENRPALRARATGGQATKDSAEIYTGLYRYIEYSSSAADAYDLATDTMVKMGIGYWRVVNDYVSNDSFDQDCFIKPIKDPLTVYMDPDIQQPNGSDARWGFIFEDIPLDLAKVRYAKYQKHFGQATLNTSSGWLTKDHVRIAEYYERDPRPDTLYSYVDPDTGERDTVYGSQISKEIEEALRRDPNTRYREVEGFKVMWYLIIGDRVVKKSEVPSKYIPIVRCVAEESVINGVYDRKGHVRNLKDPQRMLNYWATSAVIQVAFQTKTPYVGAAEAIEPYENYWKDANTKNTAYLPYKHMDENGNEIPRPQREQPPTMAPAYIEGFAMARQQMMSIAGQFEAVMGEQGPELSGKAIIERKKPGDRATYHYANALARAIGFTGEIIIDMVPRIYDTPRIIRIMGEDGEQSEVRIDPEMKQASQEVKETNETEQKAQRVFNPKVGKYEVQASAGPSWGTRREQAFDTLMKFMMVRPEFTQVIGDLIFQSADFPLSEEAASRLKRMVPLQALGDAPPPEVQGLMDQVQNLQASLASAIQALANKQEELQNRSAENQIKSYDAETKRFEALMERMELFDPKALAQTVAALLMSMQNTPLPPPPVPTAELPIQPQGQDLGMPQQPGGRGGAAPEAIQEDLGVPDAIQGIRQNRRGVHYLPDPQRPGRFVEIS